MKKIILTSLLALFVPCVSYAGNVANACVATTHCGARDNIAWKIGGGAVGWAGGSMLGTAILPGLGSWAGAIAGGYHGVKLGGKLGHAYKADEYVYFDDGTCIECDTHQIGEDYECPNGTVVTNGNVALKCHAPSGIGDDWWEQDYKIPVCQNSPVKPSNSTSPKDDHRYKVEFQDSITNGGKRVHEGVYVYSGAVCLYITEEADPNPNPKDCKPGEERATVDIDLVTACQGGKCSVKKGQCYNSNMLRCLEAAKRGEPANWNGVSCNCGDKQIWNPKEARCDDKKETKSCKESRSTAKGKACCDLPASEAKWEGNDCICLNNKEFKIENGRGKCVAKQKEKEDNPDPTPIIAEEDCYYTLDVDVRCNNGNVFKKGEMIKLTKEQVAKFGNCASARVSVQSFENTIARITQEYKQSIALIELVCGNGATAILPEGPSTSELSDATRTLEGFTSNAKKQASVWKDAEGNFNTARLASDLTAGVVLGTVGGVVSGVVIKKKQIEKGFEVLHCSVGGQKIADWGDTFTVGLKR